MENKKEMKEITILLVEDEAPILLHEKQILEEEGYRVLSAYTCKKALKNVDENKVDLILMDIELGAKGKDGVQCAKEILEQKELPIIFLTVSSEKDIISKTENVTSYGYVIKNSDKYVLLHTVKIALEHFETRQHLREREIEYRDIVDNIESAIIKYSVDGEILFFSKGAEKLFRYSAHEIIGAKGADFLWGKDSKMLGCISLEPEKYRYLEYENIRKDGKKLWMAWRNKAVYNEKEEVLYIQSIGNDITGKKKIEENLIWEKDINSTLATISQTVIEPNTAIKAIAEKVKDAALLLTKSKNGYVSTIDQDTEIMRVHTLNETKDGVCNITGNIDRVVKKKTGYTGLWGYSLNTKKGFYTNNPATHEASRGLPPGHIRIDNFLSVPALFEDTLLGQICVANKEGAYTEADLHIIKQLANSYAVVLFRNLAEQKLVRAKEKAEEADRLKSTFLASMTHEIRTPLNAIIGFIDIVLDENTLNDELKGYLETAKESCNILLMLINDILDFSKIAANQLRIEKRNYSIESVLSNIEAIGNMLIKDKKKNIQLRRTTSPFENIFLVGDSYRMEQVLINLISNAVKFTDRGFIEYGYTVKDENTLEFYIRDTGIGISDEKKEIIFLPFRQAEEKIARKYGGTGLGLSITKELIEMMGGSIYLQSKIGEGTTFYFTVPFVKGEEEANEVGTKLGSRKKKSKILVAEDDTINQKVIQKYLEKLGCFVLIAQDGRDAISLLKNDPDIDLIFMDMYMPHLDGAETTKVIRKMEKSQESKQLPIIALTASLAHEDRNLMIDAGCNELLMKPLQRDALEKVLQKYIFLG